MGFICIYSWIFCARKNWKAQKALEMYFSLILIVLLCGLLSTAPFPPLLLLILLLINVGSSLMFVLNMFVPYMFVPKYVRPKNMFVPNHDHPKICSSQNMFVPRWVCPKIGLSHDLISHIKRDWQVLGRTKLGTNKIWDERTNGRTDKVTCRGGCPT